MPEKLEKIKPRLLYGYLRAWNYANNPPTSSERGEGIASYAAIIAIALVIILAVMAIFRGAVTAAFQRIGSLLRGI